jgi:hypothetical protein
MSVLSADQRRIIARPAIDSIAAFQTEAIEWTGIAPGSDPLTVLESRVNIAGACFRFVAFRVRLPLEAGWSIDRDWSLNKNERVRSLLWDVEKFRAFVEASEALPQGASDAEIDAIAEMAAVPYSHEMAELEEVWDELYEFISRGGEDWLPAIIHNAPYLIIGYCEQSQTGANGIAIKENRQKNWRKRSQGEHHFPCVIDGMVAGLETVKVRHFTMGQKTVLKPVFDTPHSRQWLDDIRSLIETLPGFAGWDTVDISGKRHMAIILPIDAAHFEFDVGPFLSRMHAQLPPGQSCFSILRPLNVIEPPLAALIEGMAQAIRKNRVVRHNGEVFISCRRNELPATLNLHSMDVDTVLALLMHELQGVMLRGVHRLSAGRQEGVLMVDQLVRMVAIRGDLCLIHLSQLFLLLAPICREGVIFLAAHTGECIPLMIEDHVFMNGPDITRIPPMLDTSFMAVVSMFHHVDD